MHLVDYVPVYPMMTWSESCKLVEQGWEHTLTSASEHEVCFLVLVARIQVEDSDLAPFSVPVVPVLNAVREGGCWVHLEMKDMSARKAQCTTNVP